MLPHILHAQRFSVTTNLGDILELGTISGGLSYGVSRHFSLNGSVRYNPFTFKSAGSERQMQARQLHFSIGSRYWPWHQYSGWFVMGNLSFAKYNKGGIFSQTTYEGNAYGLSVGGGYALMLSQNLNLDLGLSAMTGVTDYKKYSCPRCGEMVEKGRKVFVAPEQIIIQLSYLF